MFRPDWSILGLYYSADWESFSALRFQSLKNLAHEPEGAKYMIQSPEHLFKIYSFQHTPGWAIQKEDHPHHGQPLPLHQDQDPGGSVEADCAHPIEVAIEDIQMKVAKIDAAIKANDPKILQMESTRDQ